MDCIFCKIGAGEIPAKIVSQDDDTIAIVDVNPAAPHHLLVMPKAHFENVADLAGANIPLLGKVFAIAAQLGREQSAGGFRLVVNTGQDGGQTVPHVHVHVLAGRAFSWPPG